MSHNYISDATQRIGSKDHENELTDKPKKTAYTNEDADQLYDSLITEAPLLPGDCKLQILPKDISWIQPKLLEEGRQFAKENYFSVGVAHVIAILCGVFTLKPECVMMLRTGKFHKPNYSSFLKVVSTGTRIFRWYEDDILPEDSPAFKSIQFVRRMHLSAAKWRERNKNPVPTVEEMEIKEENELFMKAIRKDLEFFDTSEAPMNLHTWTPEIEFNQLDNAMAQWAFYAWPFMFAKLFGITDLKLYDGYRHMWAVFGKLLGIEDRFNLALHCPPEMTYRYFTNFIVASLKETDLSVTVAQQAFMHGVKSMVPTLRHKPLLYYFLKNSIPEFQGNNLYALMRWYDKICLILTYFCIFLITRYSSVKKFVNWLVRTLNEYRIAKHIPKLAKT